MSLSTAAWLKPAILVLLLATTPRLDSAALHGLTYDPNDFVVAQPSCVHRLPLIKAGRQWRNKGVRLYALINNTVLVEQLNNDPESQEHSETYGYWEDDSVAAGTWRGGNVGDTRAAVTPFLAHKHFGDTYKWMLYGDDDTLFYMTGVLRLLSSFDPNVPLAITDNIWFASAHPHPGAPRCLPCSFNTSTIHTNATFVPRPACPFCTRALACGTYSPNYRCTAQQLDDMAAAYGPIATRAVHDHVSTTAHVPPYSGGSSSSGGGGGGEGGGGGGGERESWAAAICRTAEEYGSWMRMHVGIKEKYPWELRNRHSMDWEMRDGPEGWQLEREEGQGRGMEGEGKGRVDGRRDDGAREALVDGKADGDEEGGMRRADRRRLWAQGPGERKGRRGRAGKEPSEQHHRFTPTGEEAVGWDVMGAGGGEEGRRAGLKEQEGQRGAAPRPRAAQHQQHQEYVDGTPWLSSVLGPRGEGNEAQWEALRLPRPFCAVHDDRLHARPAPSCLHTVTGHGGAGIIFSVGLLRMISAKDALAYIMKQRGCGGGDCLLSRTLWHRMGIGFTDPGGALQWATASAKYDRHAFFVDGNIQTSQVVTLANPAAVLLNPKKRGKPHAPACDRACVWLIENVAATHVRAHTRQVDQVVAAMEKHLRTHALAYEWVQEARKDPQVAAGNRTVVSYVRAKYGNVTVD